ncbi:protein S100-A9 isoform X2 [Grammomys surdaster]|uniref:protein S100-A9 isoform X2 n=1 Tax=Grammomys surdaster TaxID=491861 RepID=UPI00109F0F0F|nr:protein S100-A9 isoform X2 [Grammomys surdaster]
MLDLHCSHQTLCDSLALSKKMATKTSSLMERSITTVINTFHQHSRKEGNDDTLSKKEFKEMVKTDLATFLKKEKRNERLINDIFEDLDTNQDNQLSFEECMMLMAKLVFACHEKLHENNPRGHDHSHGKGCGK